MKVAVPLLKHSPMLGQEASSHTVCRLLSRSARLTSPKVGELAARTRIQSGFFSRSWGTILIGMRAVLAAPVCLSGDELIGGSGSVEKVQQRFAQATAGGVHR